MKLINADKYKKDIEHYRNTICYQRNVTMDDCMRILDNQDDVLNKIRTEIEQIEINGYIRDIECFTAGINTALNVINKYRNEVTHKISKDDLETCPYDETDIL